MSHTNRQPFGNVQIDDEPANFRKLRKVPPKSSPFKNPQKQKNPFDKEEFEFNSHLIDKTYKYVYLISDHFITHPFVRLRKVIQLDRSVEQNSYHLTPVSIFPIVLKIQAKYGINGLMQGLTSVLITKGIIVVLESRLSEALDLNCVNYENADTSLNEEFQFKTFTKQILLKTIVYSIATPFLCVSTIDVVQSNLGFKNPGIMDFLNDSFWRAFSLNGHRTSRLIPIYLLIPPTAAYFTLNFITVATINQMTNFAIRSLRSKHEVQKNRRNKAYNEIVCLIAANLIASTLFYPIETILNRLYVQGTRTLIDNLNSGILIKPVLTNYEGFFDCKKAIMHNETNFGFYKGIGSMFLQFSIQYVILRLTKSIVKNYF